MRSGGMETRPWLEGRNVVGHADIVSGSLGCITPDAENCRAVVPDVSRFRKLAVKQTCQYRSTIIVQPSSEEVGIVIAWFYEFAVVRNIVADHTRYALID